MDPARATGTILQRQIVWDLPFAPRCATACPPDSGEAIAASDLDAPASGQREAALVPRDNPLLWSIDDAESLVERATDHHPSVHPDAARYGAHIVTTR